MAWRSSGKDQKEMVENLRRNEVIRTDTVFRAFDIVRTHLFVPSIAGQPVPEVCHDRPIRVGNVHISAPHMYATVLEALDLQPGLSMLTVGSGSGYFCTLVSTILGPTGVCHGVELLPDVVQHANNCVNAFVQEHQTERNGEPPLCACTFVAGDGYNLSETPSMKYDRIYVAAGAAEEDAAFFQQFLTIGGVLVGPFGDTLLKIARRTEDDFSSQLVTKVMFAPLIHTASDANSQVVFPSPPWTPSLAFRFPPTFNRSAACLAILQRRPLGSGCILSVVPASILNHILSFCARDWFTPEVPLVERLLQQLRAEMKARQDADSRAAVFKRERDEAMVLCMYLRAQLRTAGPPRGMVPAVDEADTDEDMEQNDVVFTLPPQNGPEE